jgi:alpha-amylase
VHQPYRLKRYSYFNIGADHEYFDTDKNRAILQKVAQKCYLPTNQILLDLIDASGGSFRISFSLTGTLVEQLRRYCPEALDSFVRLAKTGCVEFLGETYYHSLSFLYDEAEFREQVRMHSTLMRDIFGMKPRVFRNTELIYNDALGQAVADMGFRGVIAEGADDILEWRSPNYMYSVPGRDAALLLKNYRLSDDVAFRFSNQSWSEFPLTAEKFASWIHQVSGSGDCVNLFMDYETFGEHQWASTGIFDFLRHFPKYVMSKPDWNFATPSDLLERYKPCAPLSYARTTSWADVDRDLSAWRSNKMQHSALEQIYDLGAAVRWRGNAQSLDVWRKLLTSDHYYYMCTKWFADGDVHAYFSPYESPYEAFINFANVLKDFRGYWLGAAR